jgi:hypothetical protein
MRDSYASNLYISCEACRLWQKTDNAQDIPVVIFISIFVLRSALCWGSPYNSMKQVKIDETLPPGGVVCP